MTPDERALLLTTARILRALIPQIGCQHWRDDLHDMQEALAPFDGKPGDAINEAAP